MIPAPETPARRSWRRAALPAVLAVAMGLPALRGGFVGGDDQRLVLNHVLVSRPSLAHAVELFTIPHRDLYQPLPLLSLSMEFAVANGLGLFHGDRTGQRGAWLFHLTNILLHAVNSVLVLMLVRRLAQGGRRDHARFADRVGTAAAVLFAVHPLQGEVVAWINGRMMLLSTLFALAALLAFARWLERDTGFQPVARGTGFQPVNAQEGPSRRGYLFAILTVVFALLSALSKIRIELPILLGIVALAERRRLDGRFWAVWLPAATLTAIFAWINIVTTSEARMFEGGAESLFGPRPVRVLLALAFYIEKFVVPVGLCSLYPAPRFVAWADAATLRAIAIVVPAIILLGWACVRSRSARLATLWFFVCLAPTLPFVPARNLLAADRYMYLPIIGPLWMVGMATAGIFGRRASQRRGAPSPRRAGVMTAAGVAIVPLLVGLSWQNIRFYNTPLPKMLRVAQLFPDTPRIWVRVGWTYLEEAERAQAEGQTEEAAGHLREAVACAEKELHHDDDRVRGDALRLLGMTHIRAGRIEAGLSTLRQAIEADPGSSPAWFRLGSALDELGRTDEAIDAYTQAVKITPEDNPALVRLARLYRLRGRGAEARDAYEQAVANNVYEVSALLALAEMDIETNRPERLEEAVRRLAGILGWMPDNVDARVNLGVALAGLGRYPEAAEAYEAALRIDPNHPKATLNLALIYQAQGDGRAAALFEGAAHYVTWDSFDEAAAVDEGLIAARNVDPSASLWSNYAAKHPDDIRAAAMLCWSIDRPGGRSHTEAAQCFAAYRSAETADAHVLAAQAYFALADGGYEQAVERTKALCLVGEKGAAARRRLLLWLELTEGRRSEPFWTYLLAAYLLEAEGNREALAGFMGLCAQHCARPDLPCAPYLAELKKKMAGGE